MNTYQKHDCATLFGELVLILGLCLSVYIWAVLMMAL
mgnify:CR=1 FL=1